MFQGGPIAQGVLSPYKRTCRGIGPNPEEWRKSAFQWSGSLFLWGDKTPMCFVEQPVVGKFLVSLLDPAHRPVADAGNLRRRHPGDPLRMLSKSRPAASSSAPVLW